MDDRSLRSLLVSDFNLGNLAGYLVADEGAPVIDIVSGAFGRPIEILTDADAPVWRTNPEMAVVWTQPTSVSHAFRQLSDFLPVRSGELLSDVDAYCDIILRAASHLKYVLVPTWVIEGGQRRLGSGDLKPGIGLVHALMRMNLRLTESLATASNVLVLDAQRWIVNGGNDAFNPRLWYHAKIPFSNAVFLAAARDIKAALQSLLGSSRKLLIVDLDDTLWGGIVGDDGWENLRLGGHDARGEAYVDFQRALKALTHRGVILGIVSKNDEAVALTAIQNHPEMQLRQGDFAGWRINWKDKASNVIDLAAELNLGLDAVVFIDDNPAERARVREAVPDALVPEWPRNPLLFKQTLEALRCFDVAVISREDTQRATSYVVERHRTELRKQAASLEDWLRTLEIRFTVENLTRANLGRTTQLLNKTNQVNLSTRRLAEAELKEWAARSGHQFWTFRVTDKFADAGLTGLASVRIDGRTAWIVDFVMSCRVMGRNVEDAMLYWITRWAQERDLRDVRAEYMRTAKNQPCLEFLMRSGFSSVVGTTYSWLTSSAPALPAWIELITGDGVHLGQVSELQLTRE